MPGYESHARYAVTTQDLVYRDDPSGMCTVRIYKPQGDGPFPALLDVHGGAWASQASSYNAISGEHLAESGIVVAAIDFRSSTVAPHPAAMQDINYATRWLKAHASEFNATAAGIGAVGWSSGGHQVMLSAMRPRAYADLPLTEAPEVDAALDYVILGWPVIDPLARYRMAQSGEAQPLTQSADQMVLRHLEYFGDEAVMVEANPQKILERAEAVEKPPVLLIQGAADLQLPSGMAEAFVRAYSEAGGVIELGKYPGEPHGFMRNPGPNAERAFAQMKSFIARQLATVAVPA